MIKLLFTLWISTFMTTATYGADLSYCSAELGTLPIQQNGRVKPLYVHAVETLRYLTGKSKVDSYDAVTAYCLLSFTPYDLTTKLVLKAPIEHRQLQEFLELPEGEKTVSYAELVNKAQDIRLEMRRTQDLGAYQKSLTKLVGQIALYQSIVQGHDWSLPEFFGQNIVWSPLVNFLTKEKIEALPAQGPKALSKLFKTTEQRYREIAGDKHLVEYRFAKAHLHSWGLLLSLLALLCFVGLKNKKIGLFLTACTILLQIILVGARVYISGRAPVTNMYETVMFSGLGALLLSLLIMKLRKEPFFLIAGLSYNICTLMMMNFATSMLNGSIGPLVPVLRDNFWLSTHVTTIILSYGALALSWVLANTVLMKRRWGKLQQKDEKYYADLIYSTLKWGTTLLATGIILGGVWADYSWGRFWGWDPKETWSLIVLCVYMAILHGRYTAWIPSSRFIPLVAGAFMSVMMAWFGVNYILASGLHSYGFSEGGAIFLGSFFLLQMGFLSVTTLTQRKKI